MNNTVNFVTLCDPGDVAHEGDAAAAHYLSLDRAADFRNADREEKPGRWPNPVGGQLLFPGPRCPVHLCS